MIAEQPIAKVQWFSRDYLVANDYNPNNVAPMELALLKQSILMNGWTQPIVIRKDMTIVDGFHRWTIAADPQIAQLTMGEVPCVIVDSQGDLAVQMAATITHNRARGSHAVTPMCTLVQRLKDELGKTDEWIMENLGMEEEELMRLYDRAGNPQLHSEKDFRKGWVSEQDLEKHLTTHE